MSHHISMIVGYKFQFFTMFDGSILILHHCLMVKFHFCLNPSWFSRYNFPGGLQIKIQVRCVTSTPWRPFDAYRVQVSKERWRRDMFGSQPLDRLIFLFYTLETWKSWRKHHWLVVTGTMAFMTFHINWELIYYPN